MNMPTFFRHFSILLIAIIFIGSTFVFAQDDQSTAAPKPKTFALNPDNLGVIGNSVNLFSGDVNLPLNLFTLPGKNGLDVSVTIAYSSNIQNVVNTWNLETATGILGLGWSSDYEKIVVDHKGTGSRHDDDFYLIAGGASNLFVRTGTVTDNPYIYETQNHQFWKIRCYPSLERWEITRENGITYVYGDKNSNRNTVQWGVKWGNWIGSSAETTGQQQFGLAWNISEIYNAWGDKIIFEYENINSNVGSTSAGKQHTEASYLKKIKDVFGRTAEYFYGNKYGDTNPGPNGEWEYQEPHTERPEPDAYQEMYEIRYLDRIEIFDETNDKLFSVHFTYGFHGTGNQAKRLLSTITQKNADSKVLPGIKLEYHPAGSIHAAALKKIILPGGGSAEYTYSVKNINAWRDFVLTSPQPNSYKEPRVWIANNYVVVTWRNSSNQLKIYVYGLKRN